MNRKAEVISLLQLDWYLNATTRVELNYIYANPCAE